MFLWPLSPTLFHLPVQPIPDAPTGLALFSRRGLTHLALELCYFSPMWRSRCGRGERPRLCRRNPGQASARG